MKQIETEIVIDASIERVWSVFVDFESYKEWNPFLIDITGVLKEGEQLFVTAKLSKNNIKVAQPIVKKVVEGSQVTLLASKFVLFKGEHYFKFTPTSQGVTKMVHGEQFSGLLPLLFWNKLEYSFTRAFIKMNQALKDKVEAG